MRMWMTVCHDLRFQWRHKFYLIYMLVCTIYLLLLHSIPTDYKTTVALLLTFSDPSALGLILAGGIVLLEKDQGIHDNLFVTPLRVTEYLLAKASSLALLSISSAWAIHLFSIGVPASPFHFTIGILLTSSFFTLLSIGVVVRSQSVNGFILRSQLYALPFALPLLDFFHIGNQYLYMIIPTEGTLLLLKSMFKQPTVAETLYAIFILLLGNTLVFLWAKRSFQQVILMKIGKGDS